MRIGLPVLVLLLLLTVPTATPAREIAGRLTLPEGTALPEGAELHLRLRAPDAPVVEVRRPALPDALPEAMADALPDALPFSLPTDAAGAVTVEAAVHAGARALLVADPLSLAAGDSGPVTLALRPAVLAGDAAPLRCGMLRIALAPAPSGLVLHRNGTATPLEGPPEGPFAASGTTVALTGNRATLTLGDAPPLTCLPDIPTPLFPLSAGGTVPVWSVAVGRDAMALAMADGATDLGQSPDARPVPGGLVIFAAPDMNLTLSNGPCADAGSGAIHPFAATFAMPGLTLTGCGGPPAQALEGDWTVTGIAGLPLGARPLPVLTFDGPELTGDTGCNSLSASLSWDGAGLRIGPVATTRKVCPDMTAETALLATLLAALPGVTRATWDARLSVARLLAGDTPAVTLTRPAAN
jgi:heat shock protein HslJ